MSMSDENNYTEEAKLNRVLGIAKILFKTNPVDVPKNRYNDPYEFTLPKSLESLPLDTNFIRALCVANEKNFDNWGNMEDKDIVIPKLKKFKIKTEFSGSEAVVRRYQDEVEAYDEYDLSNALNNCDPCMDEGEEYDAEFFDREGDWNILDIQQISEDVNRIKQVMGLITEQDNKKEDCMETEGAKIAFRKAWDVEMLKAKEENGCEKDQPCSYNSEQTMSMYTAATKAKEEYCKNQLNESKMSEINLEGYKKKEMMGIIVEYNDMDASPTDNNDLCDELTISSVDELLSKLRGMNIPKKDKPKIINLIKKMKKETELLDSDLDISNTYLRYIQNILCTYSKEDLQNLDELKTVNESKMSEINLEGYKKKTIEEGNNDWVEILDRFPDEFQREIIDERPEGSKSDIKLIQNWELDPNYPITMNLLNLLQTKSVKEAIGRTPRHVMEMIKTNPRYRLELEDVEHVSDTEIGRKFGLKSGEIFDQNPKRYEEYANYDPETAEPSTMVNGELYWGMGRLIAALLRGDLTIKVWSVVDETVI